MNKNRILNKLENDLSYFLIQEACKNDPSKRGSSEMYRFKGLGLSVNDKDKSNDKIIAVRIGALEAQFKVESGDKVSGSLMPEDERLVKIWMGQSENSYQMRSIFLDSTEKKTIPIIPFDLEEFYEIG